MPGKVLIVDDIATNRIVLNVKLSSAGYSVVQATNASDALKMAGAEQPHLMLCPTRLQDGDTRALIKAFEDDPKLAAVARIVLSEHHEPAERLALLEAGATDVLIKPPDINALLARFRAVLRNAESHEDTLLQERMERVLGFGEASHPFEPAAQVAIMSGRMETAEGWREDLSQVTASALDIEVFEDVVQDFSKASLPDIIVIDVARNGPDKALRLLSELRAGRLTRHAKIITVLGDTEPAMLGEALDRGADDVLAYGYCAAELALRVARQAKAKRREDRRRENMHEGLRAAATDALTGLHNRRFAMPHLARVSSRCRHDKQSCAVMLIDVDHFKSVNDRLGHEAGDAALVALAKLLKTSLRAGDLASRIGGEEFMIVLPNTSVSEAQRAARRLCEVVAAHDFDLPGSRAPARLTVSIGVAVTEPAALSGVPGNQSVKALLREADLALYGSKSQGRNQATLSPKSAA